MTFKNNFKIFALILGCAAVFAACSRESNLDDDLISKQIIERICEANAKLFAENEITITQSEIDYAIWGSTLWFERKLEVNLSTKKSLAVQKIAGVFEDFRYYDETTHYLFQSETDTEPESFISSKISTGYWKYYSWDLPYLQDSLVKDIGKWREENGQFVGDNPVTEEAYVGSKYYVTLSENNKYLKLELKSATGESLAIYEYSYTANPVFPAGYQPVQFPAAKQYSVHVNWGGTYNTDTYYTKYDWVEEDLKYFVIGRIGNWGETPEVAGKMPLFYYDEACTQLILEDSKPVSVSYDYDERYYWSLTGKLSSETDGTTVYVRWENEETVYNQYGND